MKRLCLLIVAVALSMGTAVADDGVDNVEKLSVSTQMFIMDRDEIYENVPVGQRRQAMSRAQAERAERAERTSGVLAPAACVGGVDMMRAFISIDEGHIGDLEALGVIVKTRAQGFVTAFIPVDKIEAVAALPAVTHIQAATRLKPTTDKARIDTKAYDVINFTDAAKQAELATPYTGKGVVLGVIDTGIDFGHKVFQDKDGNTHIKHAYYAVDDTTYVDYVDSLKNYESPRVGESHGTHTSSIAGGSSVIIDGDHVTVTDDHASATYGGMAPEADLFLCDVGESFYDDVITDYFNMICDYADSVEKPVVINMSFGGYLGPHDGTGYLNALYSQKANDGTHISIVSAGNFGTTDLYAYKENTTVQDSCTLLWNYSKNGAYYDGGICAYSRDTDLPLAAQVMVLDTLTGEVVWKSGVLKKYKNFLSNKKLKTITNYYAKGDNSGLFRIYISKDKLNNKYYVYLCVYNMVSTDCTETATSSRYRLALSVYPTDSTASTTIDAWCDGAFVLPTSSAMQDKNYNFVKGSDYCSVSDESSNDDVICVGAYTTRNQYVGFDNASYTLKDEVGDIAYFSSYKKSGYGPFEGTKPDISAPGEMIMAAVNKTDTNYQKGVKPYVRINTNTTYPYGAMRGTSMSAPTVTGIVALWLQAAMENGITLDTKKVKEIMQATATRDEYTAASAAQFGENGKINALAGIKQILSMTGLEEKQVSDLATRNVESIHYVNLLGHTSPTPFPSLNIRVTTFTDGSTSATKIRL